MKGKLKPCRIVFIAQNQPLDNHAHLMKKFVDAEGRATRQASRFTDLDLLALQKAVHKNIRDSLLFLNGRYMDLLDLMNYVKNGRCLAEITPSNVNQRYSLANTVTLNGIYFYQYLLRYGFEPVIIQNYATCNIADVLEEDTLAVCISSNFIFMNDIREIAEQVKQVSPDIPVVAGGMLVKKALDAGESFSRKTLDYFQEYRGNVDAFVIEAMGEETLVKLLRCMKSGSELSCVPNLAYFDAHGDLAFTSRVKEQVDMDQTAIAWNAVPERYLQSALPLNSSRGCFYRCRFCTYHWLFPEVHYKSVPVLKEELRKIGNLGSVKHVRFTDDNFTANKARVKDVLKMMIREKFDFTWSSFARAGALTPDLVELMKESGCEFVDLGLESGSQTILDKMDKRLKREQSVAAVRMLNDQGIVSRGSFIIGYPGETRKTFEETIDFISESGLPYYHPYVFYYTGNTLVHKEKDSLGLKGLGLAWKHRTMDSAEASLLLSQMVPRLENSFTDGQAYVEEIYKLLRGEGYTPEEIRDLFKLKRHLQIALKKSQGEDGCSEEIENIFRGIDTALR